MSLHVYVLDTVLRNNYTLIGRETPGGMKLLISDNIGAPGYTNLIMCITKSKFISPYCEEAAMDSCCKSIDL